MTDTTICGLDLPDGSICRDPADGPQQPCKPHKLAPPASASRDLARKELISTLATHLRAQQEAGNITVARGEFDLVAADIINNLSMHVMLKVLSGMAVPPT